MKTTLLKTIGISFAATSLLSTAYLFAADPYAKPDDSWISLSGTVGEVFPDAFMLNYGSGQITVEMDDWDMDADGYKLIEGDNVAVYGYVDDGLYETRTIEAGSVYVAGLNTYFYASSADEESSIYTTFNVVLPLATAAYQVTGTVTEVNGREFTIDSGTAATKVDTSGMAYDPTDEEGFQKIEKGDRLRISGAYDVNLFEKNEVEATTIVTLDDSSRE
jgi:uncharacterized protein YdeI (BOF family)